MIEFKFKQLRYLLKFFVLYIFPPYKTSIKLDVPVFLRNPRVASSESTRIGINNLESHHVEIYYIH